MSLIEGAKDSEDPLFLLMSYHQSHTPHFSSNVYLPSTIADLYDLNLGAKFRNSTLRGPLGDAIAEMDDSIGQIVQRVEDLGMLDDTLIIFTSDNG